MTVLYSFKWRTLEVKDLPIPPEAAVQIAVFTAESEGVTPVFRRRSSILRAGVIFQGHNLQMIGFEVRDATNKENVFATGRIDLTTLMEKGATWEGTVSLEPSGQLIGALSLTEIPDTLYEFVVVGLWRLEDIRGPNGSVVQNAFITVTIGENQREAKSTSPFAVDEEIRTQFIFLYSMERHLKLEVFDASNALLIGRSLVDMWDLAKNKNLGGKVPIEAGPNFGSGYVHFGVQFQKSEGIDDDFDVQTISQSVCQSPTEPEATTTAEVAANEAIEAAMQAFDAANFVFDLIRGELTGVSHLSKETKKAAADAHKAAKRAGQAAEMAKLTKNQEMATKMTKEAKTWSKRAKKNGTQAISKAEIAMNEVVQALAKRAKLVARQALAKAEKCQEIARKYPTREARAAAKKAHDVAWRAAQEADRAMAIANKCRRTQGFDELKQWYENSVASGKKCELLAQQSETLMGKSNLAAQKKIQDKRRNVMELAKLDINKASQEEQLRWEERQREIERQLQFLTNRAQLTATEQSVFQNAAAYAYHGDRAVDSVKQPTPCFPCGCRTPCFPRTARPATPCFPCTVRPRIVGDRSFISDTSFSIVPEQSLNFDDKKTVCCRF